MQSSCRTRGKVAILRNHADDSLLAKIAITCTAVLACTPRSVHKASRCKTLRGYPLQTALYNLARGRQVSEHREKEECEKSAPSRLGLRSTNFLYHQTSYSYSGTRNVYQICRKFYRRYFDCARHH
eukprot:2664701-Rhodomonas_salina.2